MIKNGFTLIELLVVITISIIVLGVGFAGYREFSRRQALTGIIKQVKADLRLAQQLALTGQKPSGVTCNKLDSYTFTSTGSGYQLIATCVNLTVIRPVIKTVTNPINTTISGNTANSVIFKVLGQGTNLTSPLIFTIANTVAGTTGTITIGTAGDIN